MSKKTKHQKELIENKLNDTTKQLTQLESNYINLITNLKTLIPTHLLTQTSNSNITFTLNNNLKTVLYQTHQIYNDINNNINNPTNNTTNNTINNTIPKLNYDYFNTELTLLEQTKQNDKKIISSLTKQNNELENTIKNNKDYCYDSILNTKSIEDQILKDELERIDIEIQETQLLYQTTILKTNHNKIVLDNDIQLLKLEIKENNNSMEQLKQYLHTSRKNTINHLIEKKQTKLKLNTEIINNNKTIATYEEQIHKLTLHNKHLEEFKKIIIDIEYNNNSNSNDSNDSNSNSNSNSNDTTYTITLKDYYDSCNINIDLSFTEKINNIDGLIECNTNELNYITKKMNKFKLINDTISNDTNSNDTKTTLLPKIITYKNEFKNYKEKKNSLDTKLINLIYNYNNYEECVINKINSEFKLMYNVFELDKQKAYKRCTIVKERIEKEIKDTRIKIIDTIKTNKLKIQHYETNIITISNYIKELTFYITNEKNITKELTSITETINKYKSMIHTYKEELKFVN